MRTYLIEYKYTVFFFKYFCEEINNLKNKISKRFAKWMKNLSPGRSDKFNSCCVDFRPSYTAQQRMNACYIIVFVNVATNIFHLLFTWLHSIYMCIQIPNRFRPESKCFYFIYNKNTHGLCVFILNVIYDRNQ